MTEKRWQDDAACRGVDTAVFFPSKTGLAKARKICLWCPVIEECRAFNDAHEDVAINHMFGLFAGESPNERYMRRVVVSSVA